MSHMTASEIEAFLRSSEIAVLCTADEDGAPEGTPVWFDYDGDVLRILVHRDSRKARNVRANARVSLTLDTREAPYRGVVLRGTASLTGPDPALRRKLAARYLGPEVAERYLVRTRSLDQEDVLMTIRILGRSSWDYSKGYGE